MATKRTEAQASSRQPELIEKGDILFLAEGHLPADRCEELLKLNESRGVVGKNRATVLSKYFVPGENKVLMVFSAANLTQMLHALYRVPGISWTVKPIAQLDEIGRIGSDLRKACLALPGVSAKAKE